MIDRQLQIWFPVDVVDFADRNLQIRTIIASPHMAGTTLTAAAVNRANKEDVL